MATTFGKTKKTSPPAPSESYKDIWAAYTKFATDYTSATIQATELKETAMINRIRTWLNVNPLTFKNMKPWGMLLGAYMAHNNVQNVEAIEPVARYLNFIKNLDFMKFWTTPDKRSSRYESFYDVVNSLCTANLDEPNLTLKLIAENKLVDLYALMLHLKAFSQEQFDYEIQILNNPGEYKDIPESVLMRSFLSLSFVGAWELPPNDLDYQYMWEILEPHDVQGASSQTYNEDKDIIAHLVKILPQSTEKALEYYGYQGNSLFPEQRQHILSMSLAALKFPEGLSSLIYGVYHNMHSEAAKRESIQLLNLINPATPILNMYMTLYDTPEEMVNNLGVLCEIKSAFDAADAQRDKDNANELVARLADEPV